MGVVILDVNDFVGVRVVVRNDVLDGTLVRDGNDEGCAAVCEDDCDGCAE